MGNASWVLTPQKFGRPLKFGPFKDSLSPYHDTTYSDLHTKSAMCGNCHDVSHPFNSMPIERTYSEWKDSIYAAKGIDCQDCHMTPGSGVTKNPGKATYFSKTRDHIFTHFFVGGNVMVPEKLGSPKHAYLAEEMLRGAATIEIRELTPRANVRAGDTVEAVVRVTNVGAGHKLPTGFPEGREMWIDFEVKDGSGKEIYRLGQVKDGRTEPGTKSFKVTMADDAGNIVDLELWNASRIISDTRLMATAFTDTAYRFRVPGDIAEGPLTVSASLNYWSFPQALVDHLLGEGALSVPITIMASTESEIGTR
ncbi:MAG: hypothetical protein BECKG1743D_GA0114223_105534 [Candidatus Kentron sp. G]|nr:MAG: hypothetical protein BECKG1743E_GA0114224_101353 [Candidatus Kentron sp. G]VFN01267.1 MAG: hypothetical protein BECKG1743F_GA0114225_105651 [Candidatus Kentron sp. G]VFN04169.1 MAG: hypothetical protein BECKG1743D_GA0114223_105534 [Candidatus Kentron sp. G]